MSRMMLPLFAILALIAPETVWAHNSLVQVTVSLDLDSPQCLPGFATVVGHHTGTVIAIGFDDRNHQWALYGGTGSCAPFGNKPNNPFSESTVFGIVESSPYLETETRFDQRCATLPDKNYFSQTNGSHGPWNPLDPRNITFAETGCMQLSC